MMSLLLDEKEGITKDEGPSVVGNNTEEVAGVKDNF